jgi:hypothetical protein
MNEVFDRFERLISEGLKRMLLTTALINDLEGTEMTNEPSAGGDVVRRQNKWIQRVN